MRLRPLAGFIAVLLLLPAALHAQGHPQTRQGFWFNVGLGYGSLGCDDCNDEREGGFSGGFALGGTVGKNWLLGVGGAGWNKDEENGSLQVGTLDFRARFYPSATGGFFLTGGIGFGSIRIEIDGLGDHTENGAALLLGLGYDFRIGKNVSLTPFGNVFGVKNDDADANVAQIGLGVTVH
jgi:hypothetical protein